MESTDTIQAKRRGLAVLISLGAHLALLLLLWAIHLRSDRPQPKPAEVLVAVNVGNVPLASGDVEPGGTPDVTEPAPQVNPAPATSPKPQPRATPTPPTPKPVAKTPAQTASEQLQTQTHEASLQAEANRRAAAERQAKARAEAAARAAEAAAAARAAESQRIGKSVAGAFGKQSGAAGSQGTASSGAGNQGDPNGSPSSYALAGRKVISNGGALIAPVVSKAVEGTVRVRILVDGSGQVLRATISSGTNIADPVIRQAAIEAARKTRFNSVAGSEDQEGTITYHFKIRA